MNTGERERERKHPFKTVKPYMKKMRGHYNSAGEHLCSIAFMVIYVLCVYLLVCVCEMKFREQFNIQSWNEQIENKDAEIP